MTRCLLCWEAATTRGLCKKHYRNAMYQIARGQTTEQTLIRAKKLLPGGPGIAQKRNDDFLKIGSRVKGKITTPGYCVAPNCSAKVRNQRGLCVTHHSYAMDLIRKKLASEEDLTKRGLLKPKQIRSKTAPAKSNKPSSSGKSVPKKREKPLPGFVRKFKPVPKCLVPQCSNTQIHARGLCRNHYSEAKKLIKRGKTTEQDLMERKLMLPKVGNEGHVLEAADVLNKGSGITGKKANGRCRFPKCTEPHEVRGLCLKHYLYAQKLIDKGKADERDLVRRNLMLPPQYVRTKP